jgi:hypothetical protein
LVRPLARGLTWSTNLVEIQYERGHGTLGPVLRAIAAANIKVEALEVVDDDDALGSGLRHALISVSSPTTGALQTVGELLRARPEVRAVRVSSEDSD